MEDRQEKEMSEQAISWQVGVLMRRGAWEIIEWAEEMACVVCSFHVKCTFVNLFL